MRNKLTDKEYNAFFACLRAGLWGKEVLLSQYRSIDFNDVLHLAKEQSVVGLVAAGIEHAVDINVSQTEVLQFVGHTLQIEQQNKAMNMFIALLISKMRDAGIYGLLLKGQGIAQCYERPLWRACGDVDLFLSEDNYIKAKELILPIASSVETEYLHEKHQGMTIDGWVVELHGHLYSGLSPRIEKGLDEIKNAIFYEGKVRSWMDDRTQVFLPAADEDVIYVFTHILQHFYKGGIGIRQICDWCRLLWTYRDSMNHELLKSRIRKMGLMSEWKSFAAFAVDYLGMPKEAMPFFSSNEKWKRKAYRICYFIMKVGNMGHNRDNSYYSKYPFVVHKFMSFGRRWGDLWHHAKIFPLDSLTFFTSIVINGVRSAANRE